MKAKGICVPLRPLAIFGALTCMACDGSVDYYLTGLVDCRRINKENKATEASIREYLSGKSYASQVRIPDYRIDAEITLTNLSFEKIKRLHPSGIRSYIFDVGEGCEKNANPHGPLLCPETKANQNWVKLDLVEAPVPDSDHNPMEFFASLGMDEQESPFTFDQVRKTIEFAEELQLAVRLSRATPDMLPVRQYNRAEPPVTGLNTVERVYVLNNGKELKQSVLIHNAEGQAPDVLCETHRSLSLVEQAYVSLLN